MSCLSSGGSTGFPTARRNREMRYIITALVAATLLATTSVYAQQAASPAPQSGTTTGNSTATSDQDQVSRRLVRQIQAPLKQQGYLDKAPAGVWDNATPTPPPLSHHPHRLPPPRPPHAT